jgi:hypothetical protein
VLKRKLPGSYNFTDVAVPDLGVRCGQAPSPGIDQALLDVGQEKPEATITKELMMVKNYAGCKQLAISSVGANSDNDKLFMGKYSLFTTTELDRAGIYTEDTGGKPVFKHSAFHFLYYGSKDKLWALGPNIGDTNYRFTGPPSFTNHSWKAYCHADWCGPKVSNIDIVIKCNDTVSSNCHDMNERCPEWATQGQCGMKANYMQTYCRCSCGKCPNQHCGFVLKAGASLGSALGRLATVTGSGAVGTHTGKLRYSKALRSVVEETPTQVELAREKQILARSYLDQPDITTAAPTTSDDDVSRTDDDENGKTLQEAPGNVTTETTTEIPPPAVPQAPTSAYVCKALVFSGLTPSDAGYALMGTYHYSDSRFAGKPVYKNSGGFSLYHTETRRWAISKTVGSDQFSLAVPSTADIASIADYKLNKDHPEWAWYTYNPTAAVALPQLDVKCLGLSQPETSAVDATASAAPARMMPSKVLSTPLPVSAPAPADGIVAKPGQNNCSNWVKKKAPNAASSAAFWENIITRRILGDLPDECQPLGTNSCPAGQYATKKIAGHRIHCLKCPVGKYSEFEHNYDCTDCADGETTANSGSKSKKWCYHHAVACAQMRIAGDVPGFVSPFMGVYRYHHESVHGKPVYEQIPGGHFLYYTKTHMFAIGEHIGGLDYRLALPRPENTKDVTNYKLDAWAFYSKLRPGFKLLTVPKMTAKCESTPAPTPYFRSDKSSEIPYSGCHAIEFAGADDQGLKYMGNYSYSGRFFEGRPVYTHHTADDRREQYLYYASTKQWAISPTIGSERFHMAVPNPTDTDDITDLKVEHWEWYCYVAWCNGQEKMPKIHMKCLDANYSKSVSTKPVNLTATHAEVVHNRQETALKAALEQAVADQKYKPDAGSNKRLADVKKLYNKFEHPAVRKVTFKHNLSYYQHKEITQKPGHYCVDTDARCPAWAAASQCKLNPKYMDVNCKQSCSRCKHKLVCPAGKYTKDIRDVTYCFTCQMGRYQPDPGYATCWSCPSALYVLKNHTACGAKPKFVAPTPRPTPEILNSEQLKVRALVKEQNLVASVSHLCHPGTWEFELLGRVYCLRCPAGKYQPYNGHAHCFRCPIGRFQNRTAGSTCYKCLDGMFSVATRESCSTSPPQLPQSNFTVSDTHIAEHDDHKTITRPENLACKQQTAYGEWSKCDVLCGEGHVYRRRAHVICSKQTAMVPYLVTQTQEVSCTGHACNESEVLCAITQNCHTANIVKVDVPPVTLGDEERDAGMSVPQMQVSHVRPHMYTEAPAGPI